MTLFYASYLRLPTEKAHGVQIMKMCEAFATAERPYAPSVELVVPFRWRTRPLRGVRDVFDYYGVGRTHRIRRLPAIDLSRLVGIFPVLDRAVFAIAYGTYLAALMAYLAVRCKRSDTVYTRDARIARLARRFTPNVFFELHTVPKQDDIASAKSVRGVITLTKKLKAMLEAGGVSPDRVLVAPDAVDISAFCNVTAGAQELRKELHLPLDAPLIGYAGRLKTFDKEKGMPELIEAFALVAAAGQHARLVIVGGDRADEQAYAPFVRAQGIGPRIHFVPHVAPKDVPRYLKSFDVLTAPFPRGEHYEVAMSPLKVFEYAAAGVPMVVSDLPSLREVLSDNEAFFFEAGNAASLAEALIAALTKKEEASHKAESAQRTVAQSHTWRKRADDIAAFMERMPENIDANVQEPLTLDKM